MNKYTGKATVKRQHKRKDTSFGMAPTPRQKVRKGESRADHELVDQQCRVCTRPVRAPADCVVMCGYCTQFMGGTE